MDAILTWGLDVVRAVQTVEAPWLTAVMKAVTLAGSEYFYLILLPIVFWCVDERFGLRFGLVVLFSSFLNAWLKIAIGQKRPYQLDPSVGMIAEKTFALPSQHAQGTATAWGMLAGKIRKPWGLILAIAVPLVVGFTRVYLGVHFPTDVLAGWALGWGMALAWHFLGDRAERALAAMNIRVVILLAALATMGMNALNMAETSLPGVFFGTAVGAAFMFRRVRFRADAGTPVARLARFALGGVVLAIVYFGGKVVSPSEGESLYALARFVRYGLMGAWVSLGAPWAFVKLGLAERRAEA